MKYKPEGNRGFGMHSILTNFEWGDPAEMMAEVNRETMAVLQVESTDALNSIDEIAATPHLDVLFVGPYDLSISMGIVEQFQTKTFWDAIDKVAGACRKHNIAAGIQTGDINIGWGLLGHIEKGSKLLLEQRRLDQGKWRLTRLNLEGKGQILLFKSLTLKQRQSASDFRPVPDNLNIAAAVDLLRNQPATVAMQQSR